MVAVYRKLHLFDVETPEFRFQESKAVNGGNYLVSPLTDTPLEGGLGLLIVSIEFFNFVLIQMSFSNGQNSEKHYDSIENIFSVLNSSKQCYDLRFPEASTILRKNGATYLTYPSAFAYSTGLAHWETLLRTRAIENQCFVIAPAQIGYHNEKRRSYGRAIVRNPS